MSKPIARVIFSVVIALALVAGIYTSVLGASTKSMHAQVGAGLNPGLGHYGTATHGLESFGAQADYQDQSEGGCHHDSAVSPEDY